MPFLKKNTEIRWIFLLSGDKKVGLCQLNVKSSRSSEMFDLLIMPNIQKKSFTVRKKLCFLQL